MGWLYAPLEIKVTGGEDKIEFRAAQYGSDDLALKMPEVDQFIAEQWYNLGFNLNAGSKSYPLTWTEIKNYSDTRSLKLSEWECNQLIMMSREYCNWLIKAKDKFLNAPWHHPDYDPRSDGEIKRVRSKVDKMMDKLF